mmetsp:Transcript_58247/g.189870  ORF Transcript_58247/g.189870 Transcript_58247/m.189870 type:complete len:204 (+) Transcript_58247:24-635(+)
MMLQHVRVTGPGDRSQLIQNHKLGRPFQGRCKSALALASMGNFTARVESFPSKVTWWSSWQANSRAACTPPLPAPGAAPRRPGRRRPGSARGPRRRRSSVASRNHSAGPARGPPTHLGRCPRCGVETCGGRAQTRRSRRRPRTSARRAGGRAAMVSCTEPNSRSAHTVQRIPAPTCAWTTLSHREAPHLARCGQALRHLTRTS